MPVGIRVFRTVTMVILLLGICQGIASEKDGTVSLSEKGERALGAGDYRTALSAFTECIERGKKSGDRGLEGKGHLGLARRAVELARFTGIEGQARTGPLAAASFMATIPSIILFAILRKWFASGTLQGAVKG